MDARPAKDGDKSSTTELALSSVWKDRSKHEGVAMYFAKNKMLADDVLSEFYIKLAKKVERDGSMDFAIYNGKINDSYIFRMIKSCYYDIIRSEKKYSDSTINTNNVKENAIEPLVLKHHLSGLSWYERTLTEVYFRDEHSIRSLAKATNISSTNIHLTLKKTKNHMANSINKEVVDEIQKMTDETLKEKGVSPPKRKPKSKGLGDAIEKVTKKTGIKKAVDWFSDKTGIDCGCEERKEKLNKLFPRKKISCMSKEQYELWKKTTENFSSKIKNKDLKNIAKLHSELFNHKYYEPCRCEPKTWRHWVVDINKIFESYEAENN